LKETAKFNINQLLPIIMVFVVAGVAVVYGLDVTEDVKHDIGEEACSDNVDYTTYNATDGNCYNASDLGQAAQAPGTSAAYNSTGDVIDGVAKFPEKFGTLATVIIAAIILGVLVTYLAFRNR
jgi:hypothetical protein